MRIGVGLSTSPDPQAAASEAAGAAVDGFTAPTLAFVVISRHHARRAARVLEAVHQTAAPESLVGCAAAAVVAGRREVDEEPAVAVWLAELPSPVETYHMEYVQTSAGAVLGGYQFDPVGADTHLLVADPHTFPASVLLSHLNLHAPATAVVGGFAGGGRAPATLLLDTRVITSGAVGVRLPGVAVRPVISQGCRPIGDPYTVTSAQDGIIAQLAGRPPLRLLESLVASLPPDEQRLVSTGVHLGVALDEYKAELGVGDFLIRSVIGADEQTGSIQLGEPVDVGTTVQFHVRDAVSADEDLYQALTRAAEGGRPAGALLFTCNGRGRSMFDEPDHDAALVGKLLGDIPVAGFFAAGEFCPVGGRNFVHTFTASLALFDEVPGDG